jgi:transcriptional regulator with XRE-family HTH domain
MRYARTRAGVCAKGIIMARENPLVLRRKLRLNQTEFWGRVGVTQSGGSRYENGNIVPGYLKLLIELAYGNNPLELMKRIRSGR